MKLEKPAITFREYVMQPIEPAELERAREYWRGRAGPLPDAPQLPLLNTLDAIGVPQYERITAQVGKNIWEGVKTIAAGLGGTPSCILLDLFSQALAEWSGTPRFCLNA